MAEEKAYLESLNNDNKRSLTIVKSLNSSLTKILSENTKQAISVIVDSNGNGTYTTIQDAVNSGATLIIVKEGNYSISSDLELTNQYILGENREKVIITLIESSINFKEVSKISSVGTVQFTEGDRTVDGDNTTFTNLSGSNDNKFLYTEGKYWEIDTITSNTFLELKTEMYGQVQDAIDDTVLETNQISFEAEALYGGIENVTLVHSITKVLPLITINGFGINIKNINFYEENGLSNFIIVSKSNTKIALKTLIENNHFEGGANAIKINKAFLTTIENNYFTAFKEKAIELFSTSEHTTIINNIFSSGLFGIEGNTKHCKVFDNQFSFIKENCIKFNYSNFTTDFSYNQIEDNSFYRCNSEQSFTTNGTIAIRGSGNIISNASFYECKRPITLNCKRSIATEIQDVSQAGNEAIVPVGDNNIISNLGSDGTCYFSVTAQHSIFDGISANPDTLTAILEQGSFSIGMNIVQLTEEYYHGNDSILFNSLVKMEGGSTNTSSRETTFDNDMIDGDFFMNNASNIAAFNLIMNPANAIDVTADSVCKGNLVEAINPPVTDTALNNIEIYNYF